MAGDLIESYVKCLEDFFDVSVYDYTLHAHLHLRSQVEDHGPLHSNSQFVFEVR